MELILEELIANNAFYSKENFERIIETKKKELDGSYIDAIILFCEENQIDYTEIKGILTPSLILKIENEAIRENMIKGGKVTRKNMMDMDIVFS